MDLFASFLKEKKNRLKHFTLAAKLSGLLECNGIQSNSYNTSTRKEILRGLYLGNASDLRTEEPVVRRCLTACTAIRFDLSVQTQ